MAQINKPTDYFNTKLYTGNGSTQSITGVGFQPDLVYIKSRSAAHDNFFFDSVRGATIRLRTNLTSAESTQSNALTSFDSDGFSSGNYTGTNENTTTYASWNWLASNTTASNTDGSITSTVSANTTSGFSIVSYTGTGSNATVGHGLGTTPACIISKNRNDVDNWNFWHQNLSATSGKYMTFNDTGAEQTDSTIWNTAPTSTVFGIGTNNRINGSSDGMIAYCFAEKKGFSKFGSYTGNGSADGTFAYCGFKPAFLIVKRTDSAGYSWLMYDNKRQVSFNVIDDFLYPNTSDAETTGNANQSLDFLSNGVKFRGSGASSNASGGSYIYMCFAENPLVSTAGVPCTAR